MKVMFVLIVHKKEVPAGSNSGERIYNHSVKRQHPLLERNWESHDTLLKRLWTCIELVFAIFVWLCVCVCVRTWTVQLCPSQLLAVFSVIRRLSYPVSLHPAGSSCGSWAADGLLYWRPSPPVGEGRRQRRAGTDTWANRKNVHLISSKSGLAEYFCFLFPHSQWNYIHLKEQCHESHTPVSFTSYQ